MRPPRWSRRSRRPAGRRRRVHGGELGGDAAPRVASARPGRPRPRRTRAGASSSPSSRRSAAPRARGSRGGTRSPVTPVDHGVGQAADRGADHRHAAGHRLQRGEAERLVPGRGGEHVGRAVPAPASPRRGTAPTRRTRSATPQRSASARSRRAYGSASSSAGRAADDDQLGVRAPRGSARITSSKPLRSTSRPTVRMRGRPRPRGAAGPSGRNRSVFTPDGTSAIRDRGTPSRSSSRTSSWHCTTTRSTARPSCPLVADPLRRAGVGGALVAALDRAERVEGLHHRHVAGRGRR